MRFKKGKELTEDDLINKWLGDYYNTSIKEVIETNKWDIYSKEWDTNTFYDKYPVTEEQYDEWKQWVINELYERTNLNKKYIKNKIGFTIFNAAPKIKR